VIDGVREYGRKRIGIPGVAGLVFGIKGNNGSG
jgi:hypothetical protein